MKNKSNRHTQIETANQQRRHHGNLSAARPAKLVIGIKNNKKIKLNRCICMPLAHCKSMQSTRTVSKGPTLPGNQQSVDLAKMQIRLWPVLGNWRTIWRPLLLPLLLVMIMQLLLPMPEQAAAAPTLDRKRCAHKGIAELIRTSPVIVKALGARIFSEAELSKNAAQTFDSAAEMGAAILITLTPETIYKGASLLKVANGATGDSSVGVAGMGSGTRRSSQAAAWSGGGNSAESAYQYEGQLNATLQPLGCFDANLLKILPTELIAFGKLLPASASKQQLLLPQEQQQQQQIAAPATVDMADKDVLHISINGLHRWSPQFENHIWKHLGWDDWSDFTLCSVTCGKGVQQRFRRCLLDNPLVDINMNMNLNDGDDDDEDVEDIDADANADEQEQDGQLVYGNELMPDEANNDVSEDSVVTSVAAAVADEHDYNADNNEVLASKQPDKDQKNVLMMQTQAVSSSGSSTTQLLNVDGEDSSTVTQIHTPTETQTQIHLTQTLIKEQMNKMLHKFTKMAATAATSMALTSLPQSASMAMRTHVPDTKTSGRNEQQQQEEQQPSVSFVPSARNDQRRPRANQHKKRKSAKSLSTLLCEGYNIEQRNCNAFECSDDISDLLKFYKKLPVLEELQPQQQQQQQPPLVTDYTLPIESSSYATALGLDAVQQQPSSTPANMGYIRSWHNALNFTLMITLRSKNDTKNTATIFSIRNATHNLYLEACKDGLRLYLERDNTTEMLPVKFNLYDYRWHQVAISIQNGDFISIYVDCTWTNSFVVSKRLYTLPLDADVEIGRGFNGELQQLLILPEHQERLQCSNKRISINEVKRYIIDTFIDDYGGN